MTDTKKTIEIPWELAPTHARFHANGHNLTIVDFGNGAEVVLRFTSTWAYPINESFEATISEETGSIVQTAPAKHTQRNVRVEEAAGIFSLKTAGELTALLLTQFSQYPPEVQEKIRDAASAITDE